MPEARARVAAAAAAGLAFIVIALAYLAYSWEGLLTDTASRAVVLCNGTTPLVAVSPQPGVTVNVYCLTPAKRPATPLGNNTYTCPPGSAAAAVEAVAPMGWPTAEALLPIPCGGAAKATP